LVGQKVKKGNLMWKWWKGGGFKAKAITAGTTVLAAGILAYAAWRRRQET
jgi:hypothetical protein